MNTKMKRFGSEEDGAGTPMAIGLCVIFIALGGLAVDFNKAVSERTQMQLATDSAAHAALYSWEFESAADAKTDAMATISGMLPDIAYRDALQASDIELGYWDLDTGTFTADDTYDETYQDDKDSPFRSAVRATARLEDARNNSSRNILLSIVGQDTLEIAAFTTYANYYPPCLREGIVADDVADLQSNSNFSDGFCLHSNTYVSLNSNNFFEPGTVVSMPSLQDLDIPESGFESNEGLQAALRQGKYRLRILRQLPSMFASLRTGSPKHAAMGKVTVSDDVIYPINMSGNGANAGPTADEIATAFSGTTDPTYESSLLRYTATNTGKKNVSPMAFMPRNRIYRMNCSGNGDITFSGDKFEDFVLVTNCDIKFSNGAILDNVLIATEGNVSAVADFQIGLDDNCAEDGNAGIWLYGDFSVPNGLQAYGAQILSLGNIDFTAQANGIEGVSFIAMGTIDGTSSGDMGYCNGMGTDDFAEVPYFRAVN